MRSGPNIADVVVQGALFLVVLVLLLSSLTMQSTDLSRLDLDDAAHFVLVVVSLAGACVAVA